MSSMWPSPNVRPTNVYNYFVQRYSFVRFNPSSLSGLVEAKDGLFVRLLDDEKPGFVPSTTHTPDGESSAGTLLDAEKTTTRFLSSELSNEYATASYSVGRSDIILNSVHSVVFSSNALASQDTIATRSDLQRGRKAIPTYDLLRA